MYEVVIGGGLIESSLDVLLKEVKTVLDRIGADSYSTRFIKPVMEEMEITFKGTTFNMPYPKEPAKLVFSFVNASDATYFKLRFGGV